MRVRVLRSVWWQDAGVERPLDAGQVVRLPAVVAEALVRQGVAVVEDVSPRGAPERAVVGVREHKAGRER